MEGTRAAFGRHTSGELALKPPKISELPPPSTLFLSSPRRRQTVVQPRREEISIFYQDQILAVFLFSPTTSPAAAAFSLGSSSLSFLASVAIAAATTLVTDAVWLATVVGMVLDHPPGYPQFAAVCLLLRFVSPAWAPWVILPLLCRGLLLWLDLEDQWAAEAEEDEEEEDDDGDDDEDW
ncbi:hypothetical protein B0H63DRAFT_513601 [Podospora didyma]|uniref:Uncharacterized protein n=1 Tax=Podospora didyma TaxID=330526 RepID=A0AAE0N7A9_9PEZI|nr:hypothetical protein B0H63DRAFT_513601 [Podospora didyma]